VVGAHLCGENDKSYWEDQLDRLEQVKVSIKIYKILKNDHYGHKNHAFYQLHTLQRFEDLHIQ